MSVRLSTAIKVADAAEAVLLRVQANNKLFPDEQENLSGKSEIWIDPMLLALSMELALKAWFMFDFDTAEVKKSHNLGKLFEALKEESRNKLSAAFRSSVAPIHYPDLFYGGMELKDVLEHHADAFVDWRYLHEATQLHFNLSSFVAIIEMALREFRKRYREVRVEPVRCHG